MRFTSVIALLMVTAQVNAATVVVVSTPGGAEVFIGENSVGTTPCKLSLPAGKLKLTLKHAKAEDLLHEFEVGKKLVILRLKLPPKKFPVDLLFEDLSQAGWSVFSTRPAAYLGRMPGTVMLSKGIHRLLAVKDGFIDVVLPITVGGTENQLFEVGDPKPGKSSIRRIKHLKYVGRWKYASGDEGVFRSDFKYERYWRGRLACIVSWKFVWPDTIYVQFPEETLMLKEDKGNNLVGVKLAGKKLIFRRMDK